MIQRLRLQRAAEEQPRPQSRRGRGRLLVMDPEVLGEIDHLATIPLDSESLEPGARTPGQRRYEGRGDIYPSSTAVPRRTPLDEGLSDEDSESPPILRDSCPSS
eukprot:3232705-Pyramimonas_sp.AAC.1